MILSTAILEGSRRSTTWAGRPAGFNRILERTGRPAEAREAYEFFAYAWRNADREQQPMVDEARRAVARLSDSED